MNHETGAGVTISGDYPLWDFMFYVEPQSICAELFVFLSLSPGEIRTWQTTYDFIVR